MRTFYVGKDFQTLEKAGMSGWFQVDTLLDEDENNISNEIDVGQHFHSDTDFKIYLAQIFNIDGRDIELIEL